MTYVYEISPSRIEKINKTGKYITAISKYVYNSKQFDSIFVFFLLLLLLLLHPIIGSSHLRFIYYGFLAETFSYSWELQIKWDIEAYLQNILESVAQIYWEVPTDYPERQFECLIGFHFIGKILIIEETWMPMSVGLLELLIGVRWTKGNAGVPKFELQFNNSWDYSSHNHEGG